MVYRYTRGVSRHDEACVMQFLREDTQTFAE